METYSARRIRVWTRGFQALLSTRTPLVTFLICVFLLSACSKQPTIRIVVQQSTPMLDFAARELAGRLEQNGYSTKIERGVEASATETDAIILNVDPASIGRKPESFEILPMRASGYLLVRITGAD